MGKCIDYCLISSYNYGSMFEKEKDIYILLDYITPVDLWKFKGYFHRRSYEIWLYIRRVLGLGSNRFVIEMLTVEDKEIIKQALRSYLEDKISNYKE